MKTFIKLPVIGILVLLAELLFISKQHFNDQVFALTGAKIYPSPYAEPIVNGVVVIKNGIITDVGPRQEVQIDGIKEVIDCHGLTMTAGFWNSHVHLMEPKWIGSDTIPSYRLEKQLMEMLTAYGFTYAVDLGTLDFQNLHALRTRIHTGEIKGPEILSAGVPFAPNKASPFYIAPLKLPELSDPAQAVVYVKDQIAKGADAIKLWTASPTGSKIVNMPLEVVRQTVEMANQLSKPVVAHPSNNEGVEIAIDAGIHMLAHVSPDDRKLWDDEMITRMVARKIGLIPTLKLYKWDLEQHNMAVKNNPLIITAIGQLKAFSSAGGEVLFGTDVGFMTDYSPTDEYELMAQAGMTFSQILASLTTTPAKRFDRSLQTGKIQKGMHADIVLLSADPSENPKNFSKVVYTFHKGKVIYRAR